MSNCFNNFLGIILHHFFKKNLYEADHIKNDTIVKNLNESLIYLSKFINSKEIPENQNPEKVVNIAEKTLDFNKQQKSKRIKILTPKQMLQRLPRTLAQVKAGNTSENLLNEIRQIIYSLYQGKEVTKKYITI